MRIANPDPTTVAIGISTSKHTNRHIHIQSLIQPIPIQGAQITPIKKAMTAPNAIMRAITSTNIGRANIIPIKFNKAFFLGIDYNSL